MHEPLRDRWDALRTRVSVPTSRLNAQVNSRCSASVCGTKESARRIESIGCKASIDRTHQLVRKGNLSFLNGLPIPAAVDTK